MLTAETIANRADRFTGRANTAAINRTFRRMDQSHLWPILGKFDATERAIRRVRKDFAECGMICEGLEYALALESEVSAIVNGGV